MPVETRLPWRTLHVLALPLIIYWVCLLVVSFEPRGFDAPGFLLQALIVGALPVVALTGFAAWRLTTRRALALAFRDELTALGNRRAFLVKAQSLLRRASTGSIALIMVDVDGLKVLNEECGHQAGDELLTAVARRLEGLAGVDGSIYRIGGDEFSILIDRASGEQAASIIRSLQPYAVYFRSCGHKHVVRTTTGFASGYSGETFESLFRRADMRLRDGKRELYALGAYSDRRMQTPDEPTPADDGGPRLRLLASSPQP
jgi:diguanylate cyclase (GGDEF)-like protein